MKILMAGDIAGAAGRGVFARTVTRLKESGKADFVVANAENAAGGKGLTGKLAEELFSVGADVLTLGDHTWDQKELEPVLDREDRLLRPANFAPGCSGHGYVTVDTAAGPVTVINLIGRVFMRATDCPFRTVDAILKQPGLGRIVLVDFHAEATSEKMALGRFLDGRVTAVVGTHTHVQTADECILPRGTAYITDLGMTGPRDSIIGCEIDSVLSVFLTGARAKFEPVKDDKSAMLEGVLMDIDEKSGRATRIRRIRE